MDWKKYLIGKNFRLTLIRICVLVVFVFVLFKFVFLLVRCEGISMEPNYANGTIHVVYRLAYRNIDPVRGDVVCIANEHVKTFTLMKRIIGLPGENVEIRGGIVYIDGQPLDEPWMKNSKKAPWNRESTILKENQYLVIGDNRNMPMQFHTFGEVDRKNIVGKVVR